MGYLNPENVMQQQTTTRKSKPKKQLGFFCFFFVLSVSSSSPFHGLCFPLCWVSKSKNPKNSWVFSASSLCFLFLLLHHSMCFAFRFAEWAKALEVSAKFSRFKGLLPLESTYYNTSFFFPWKSRDFLFKSPALWFFEKKILGGFLLLAIFWVFP